MGLQQDITGYLSSQNWSLTKRSRDLLVGNRPGLAGEREYIYVWAPEAAGRRDPETLRRQLMADFGAASKEFPSAQRWLVMESYGLGNRFRMDARHHFDVNVRSPVEFFDQSFKWDTNPASASAAKDLQRRGDLYKRSRVAQPFQILRPTTQEGEDILPVLRHRLQATNGTEQPIHLVVGPAGMGKSYFFASLYAALYEDFINAKRAHYMALRPLPLLPEYLDQAESHTISGLLDAYLRTDFMRPLDRRLFQWMITSGSASWLLDGLDEVIVKDAAFFTEHILELVTQPRSAAHILICLRDSLLATNSQLRDFVDECGDALAIYNLTSWQDASKRQYGHLRFPNEEDAFRRHLSSNASMNRLSSTPFYCKLIADAFEADDGLDAGTEADLLEHALSSVVSRERGKGLLKEQFVSDEDVRDFLEGAASESLAASFEGVRPDDLRLYAEVIVSEDLESDTRRDLTAQLVQLPLFVRGEGGRVRFAQELLEQYLLACSLLKNWASSREMLLRKLSGSIIPRDWVTLEVMADELAGSGGLGAVVSLAHEAVTERVAFRNTTQLAAMVARRSGNFAALKELPFQRQDLEGIAFDGLDLNGVSFRDANLQDVSFRQSMLQDAVFAGAIMRNTCFTSLAPGALIGADFGDLKGFYGIQVGETRIADPGDARDWIEERTARRHESVEPCPAALQVRRLFTKFVLPDGQGRRDWLDRRAGLRGVRLYSPQKTLEQVLDHGYLTLERSRDRLVRPGGDAYSDMQAYVRSMSVSRGLKALLDDLCGRPECSHVPVTSADLRDRDSGTAMPG